MKSKINWLKEKAESAQSAISTNFSAVVATTGSLLSQVDLLKWSQELTDSAATIYDKALDLEYLKTHIGGGDHRLFDGGHDIFSAWDRAKEASAHDSFSEEVIGYISSLWKDVTTTKGLPFETLDKAAFESFADKVSSWNIPGLDREFLVDLLSFDAFEVLSSGLATASVLLALKKDDQEKLAEILGSLGIVAIISANPIMGIFVILLAAYAYVVKKKDLDKVALSQGALLSGLSLTLFSIISAPFLLEIGIVLVLTGLTKKFILKNEDLHRLVLRHLKALRTEYASIRLSSYLSSAQRNSSR